MSEYFKILAQLNPSATLLTDLYTVPASTSASISSIVICNSNNTTTALFRISIAAGGAADNIKQYLYYDLPIAPNDTFIATIGVSLGTTDVIRVYSNTADLSFNIFGVEVA